MTDEMKNNELNEQQLESVSGGEWAAAKVSYKSGSEPRYYIGQKVIYCSNHRPRRDAVVIDITKDKNGNYKKSGLINTEFTYTIRYDDNGQEEDSIYESQLCSAWRG